MLTWLGVPFLVWLDEKVMPEAFNALAVFDSYVGRWRDALDV